MKLVKKWNVGFTFEHINELGDCSQLEDQYLDKVNSIREFNKKVFMENFIWRLENMYATLLGINRKGIPSNIKKINVFEYGKEDVESLLQ